MSYISPEDLTGSTLLLGVDRYDHEGSKIEPLYRFGRVVGVSDQEGILLDAGDGDIVHIPAVMDAVYIAPSGTYKPVSGSEPVTDPDFFTMWKSEALPPPDTSTNWTPYSAPMANRTIGTLWNLDDRYDGARMAALIDAWQSRMVGQTILVGVAYYEMVGDEQTFVRHEQFHGTIKAITFGTGVVVATPSGDERTLPPDITMIQPAPPGEYRLRSTGEVVVNPGFIAAWAVIRPERE